MPRRQRRIVVVMTKVTPAETAEKTNSRQTISNDRRKHKCANSGPKETKQTTTKRQSGNAIKIAKVAIKKFTYLVRHSATKNKRASHRAAEPSSCRRMQHETRPSKSSQDWRAPPPGSNFARNGKSHNKSEEPKMKILIMAG